MLFRSLDGTLNQNIPNQFNDVRLVLVLKNATPTIIGKWEGTTEPGKFWTEHPMTSQGAARIAFGQYKAWAVGFHHGDPEHEALVQVNVLKVHRDLNQDYSRKGDKIDVGSGFGINQHWGYDLPVNDLGRSSAGCLVGRTKKGHREFMALVKDDPRYNATQSYKFLTTVMDGADLMRQTV